MNGQQLTIREGTRKRTYTTARLTIPAGAIVRDNRHAATLGDVKPGQRVLVVRGPKHTWVLAHDVRHP